ncbi:MAG: 16S rRNA (cytidine(1402)-2'-O)-methyltransferase [Chloroflexota bacterium]|nr:16S rRNA (cytidine(1402)-2'-O)-methyltransferase [Chloroflexota bacterium]
MGTLYVVGTPIGNLEDVTLRAIRILREADVIAAEDTRVTRTVLAAHDIRTPLVSFHEFSGPEQVRRLVERLQVEDVALVCDAGMPGLSDPGFPLIRAALDAGIPVVPIPGPSAILAALVASGQPMHAFSFYGFLPRKSGERRRFLERLREVDHTVVVFESPHRVAAALRDVAEVLGTTRPIAACRELTKKFEEVVRGPAGDVAERLGRGTPRGEFTLVIGPSGKAPGRGARTTDWSGIGEPTAGRDAGAGDAESADQ